MGIEVAAVAGAYISAAEQYRRQKFAGNPGHAHEDPILAKRRDCEREEASRETRIAADLATVQRDNRIGLGLIVALLLAFLALVASCVGPEPAYAQPRVPNHDLPVLPSPRGHDVPAGKEEQDNDVRGGGTY